MERRVKLQIFTETTEVKTVKGQWTVVEEVEGNKKYDYAPDREQEVTKEVKVFEQILFEIEDDNKSGPNLEDRVKAAIKAFNGIT